MTTIKKLVYDILLVDQGCRNSDRKLIWRVWKELGFVDNDFSTISEEKYMNAPSSESVRRCRQALQRTDLLSGEKLIQPAEAVKKQRVNMAKTKGYEFQQGKAVYNPITNCYEI